MHPTTLALYLLILAAVCLADSDQRGDRAGCSSSGCAKEERELARDNHAEGTNAAREEGAASVRSPAAAASRPARSPAHDSHQQDSSSPLLKVNFWLTLLISALAAALLS
uniref:Putative secreted protein n=1 Tax=Amblyomma parvum TaxID=251391 RepID=A0A023FT37_AMBPA